MEGNKKLTAENRQRIFIFLHKAAQNRGTSGGGGEEIGRVGKEYLYFFIKQQRKGVPVEE